MRIKIGTTLYLGGDSKYQISPSLQGLESPAIRMGDGLYAGRDGGYVSGHFYGHRTLVIKGFYIGRDCEEADMLRRQLFGYLRIRYKTPIFIEDFSENIYYTEGYISSIKADLERGTSGEYQITIICPDPILYKATSMDESTIWREESLSYATDVSINNTGNVNIYPIITLNGALYNPQIINNTTSQGFALELETESSDTLVINFEKRLVLLNGNSVNSTRTADSQWIYLLPEVNLIRIDDESGSASITANIKYKEGMAGI